MMRVITNVVTCFLILYNSYNAYKAKIEKHQKLKKRYNMFFMVIAVFLGFDSVFGFLLNLLPFYQAFKLGVIIWMSVPMCSGSVFIYKYYMNSLFLLYQDQIDKYLICLRDTIKIKVVEYYEMAYSKISKDKNKENYKIVKDNNMGLELFKEKLAEIIDDKNVSTEEEIETSFMSVSEVKLSAEDKME